MALHLYIHYSFAILKKVDLKNEDKVTHNSAPFKSHE